MSERTDYFANLLPQLADRSCSTVLSRLGFAHTPLYRHLSGAFRQPFGQPGSLLAAPTFEATFGWEPYDKQMGDLAGKILTETLVEAMDNPPDYGEERCPERSAKKRRERHPYRFGCERHPYRHQLAAWNILAREPAQSLIVASGTGSGKTECFMVPILDRLVREQAEAGGRLTGVRALFLYPLNALINSQRERLRAWTDFAKGDIRFCLYNGNTPEKTPTHKQRQAPNEVLDRTALREAPPPLLVTNATMLEYMLVRALDAPILEQSQGKLQWVVLDEAHTYVGSQAAELALLIRRVLHAFGVSAEQVRFVATSATIGDPSGEAGQRLKTFLAEVAGVDEGRVHLVAGRREVPELPGGADTDPTQASIDDLWALDREAGVDRSAPERYAALAAHPHARALRQLFIDSETRNRERGGNGMVASLDEVCRALYGEVAYDRDQQREALRWLDLLSGTRDAEGRPFLPLRAHLFHQTLTGLWACSDPACPGRDGTALDDPTWPFGQVYMEPRQHCRCGAPAYELVACDDCGAPHLMAADRNGRLLQPKPPQALDEFELDIEPEEESEGEESEKVGEDEESEAAETRVLVVNRPGLEQTGEELIERQSRRYAEREIAGETLWLTLQSDAGEGLSCPCCGGHSAQGRPKQFQEARIGTPFALSYLLPTLLEFAPDERCKPVELPYRGRRLLTFNDSRQGTARMAARLQQESERNRVRGLIYHLALREGQQQGGAEVAKIKEEIAGDETVLRDLPKGGGRAYIEKRLAENRDRLAQLPGVKPVRWGDVTDLLAKSGQDFDRMLDHYRKDISRDSFGGDLGPRRLAELLLIREFGRRPKRLNNLESMGLVAVTYPELDKVQEPHPPFSRDTWHDFLKIALDHFVRGGGSLVVDEASRRWLGSHFPQNWLVARDRRELERGDRRWPRAVRRTKTGGRQPNRRSTLVRLLAYVLDADLDTDYGEDLVDDALETAWRDLTEKTGILRAEAGGRRRLPVSALAFTPITSVWVCPVTRRFLDTTLNGITPYLPMEPTADNARCRPVTLPLYDRPFGGDMDAMSQVASARQWIAEQDTIDELRREGLWDPLNDRTIELAPYFTAAEHSAQQDTHHLDRYERAFKSGELNLLSCSTTMEMGIDIGGIAMVAMNNVPPHPANYLQRAGRAGRRQEGRSLAFTLCKPNPHDQIVFGQTDWPFTTPLPSPKVSLDSEVIAQRHLNALALAGFLKRMELGTGQDSSKLNSGGFFTAAEDGTAPVQRFIDDCNADQAAAERLEEGIRSLTRRTGFEGMDPLRVRHRIAEEMEAVWKHWRVEWDALCQQVEATGPDGNPAHKAAVIQRRRLEEEYLLRELADRGFLPAYGFPTHIAAFDNLTAQQVRQFNLEKQRSEDSGRDDNRYRHRELPSRDSVTALREYAPGAEVVMDGLVYRCAGITLNWKVPATASEAREPQAVRHAWRCRDCGETGSARVLEQAQHCEACGAEIVSGNQRHFIEPAGYAVDFYNDPHNNVSTQDFIPAEPAWISAAGDWEPLPNPELGYFRVTTRGHIFHHSQGLHGQGYALCLECGRAEPQTASGELPERFQKPHTRLRGDRKDRGRHGGTRECPGSHEDWKIKRDISLGVGTYTDVLEIQLANTDGAWLNDRITALTLAVALRDSLAGLLGVRIEELGCAVKQTRPDSGPDRTPRRSIFVFDHHGAGYASSAGQLLERLFHDARNHLDCRAGPDNCGCDSACPHCILAFDQRFEADSLDRHQGLEFLSKEWLDA